MRCLLVAVVCLGVACKSEDIVLRFDPALKSALADQTMRALEASAKTDAAIERLFGALADDAHVLAKALALGDTLMANATIASAIETIMTQMGEDPAVLEALAELTKQHPDASPDEIGELFGALFETRWDTPPVSAAWFAAWNAFLAKLGESPALTAVSTIAANRMVAGVDDAKVARTVSARLVELNGGARPDQARARELYLQHVWSIERIDEMYAKIFGNPTLVAATTRLVADVLGEATVVADLERVAAALAGKAEVQALVVRGLVALYAKDMAIAEVKASLNALMTHPVIVGSVRDLLESLIESARVRELAERWFETVRKDPAFERDFFAFMTGGAL